VRLGWSRACLEEARRKLGRLVTVESDPRTWSEDRSQQCSFEAVDGRARERHEARLVVSGGTEHALTVLWTGRCGGGSLLVPRFLPAARPLLAGRMVYLAGHIGGKESSACSDFVHAVHAPSVHRGSSSKLHPFAGGASSGSKECLECLVNISRVNEGKCTT